MEINCYICPLTIEIELLLIALHNRTMKYYSLFTAGLLMFLCASCASVREVSYLTDVNKTLTIANTQLHESHLAPKDLVTVNIQTSKPELAAPFNGLYWSPTQQYTTYSEQQRQYLVDNEGQIDMPILGKVKLAGLTEREAEDKIRDTLKPYLQEIPSVNIRIMNYRYSVIGEVKNPGMYIAENGKVNIYEALAKAGDMTIYGVRNKVKILREDANGTKTIEVLDLNSSDILKSPYFYLQQGDVIYVSPNGAQASASKVSSGVTVWFSVASIGFSLVNLLVTLLRK